MQDKSGAKTNFLQKCKKEQEEEKQDMNVIAKTKRAVKDEKKFDQLIKWAKRNRKKAEKFNNKIKKIVIQQENENKNMEMLLKKNKGFFFPENNNNENIQNKIIHSHVFTNNNQNNINNNKNNESRRGSLAENNIKGLESIMKKGLNNITKSKIDEIQEQNEIDNEQIHVNSKEQLYDGGEQQLLQENNSIKIEEKNNTNPALLSDSIVITPGRKKQMDREKMKEEYEKEFKQQIRREMMVDNSIGGKLSYKLMLKMEQFFERYQLKNPKEKSKIINHLHYEQDPKNLQQPVAEQEGAFEEDKDFIRRDDYWSNLFAKDNTNVYSLRTPDQFNSVNKSHLNFPQERVVVDINLSETIQDKINKIKVIRFKDRIDIQKQKFLQREQIQEQIKQEKMKQLQDKIDQDNLLLEIQEKGRKAKINNLIDDVDDQFVFQNKDLSKRNINNNNLNIYSINNQKTDESNKQSFFVNPSWQGLTTAATNDQISNIENKSNNNNNNNEKSSTLKKRNHVLELDEIQIDTINSMQELKKKKNAINKLYERLFPQKDIVETPNKQYIQMIQQKDNSEQQDELSIHNFIDKNKSHKQSIILSPQPSHNKIKNNINNNNVSTPLLMRSPSNQISRQSSLNKSLQQNQFQQDSNNNLIHRKSSQYSRKMSSLLGSPQGLNSQREKIKQKLEFAPAKLQKQYKTYFQLSHVPYMSEIGMSHQDQIKLYANTLEEYCPNPFEKINHLNEIIDDYVELNNPELVKKKIYQDINPPPKPRFEMKKYDEIEFLQKKVNFQYREHDKIQKQNIVDDEQNQIITHNLEKRIKSFSSSQIKKPQINFYKEKQNHLTQSTQDEFKKVKNIVKDLQKVKINENKKAKRNVSSMKKFSNKNFVYIPQEFEAIKYNFPPYPIEKQEDIKQNKSVKNKHFKITHHTQINK